MTSIYKSRKDLSVDRFVNWARNELTPTIAFKYFICPVEACESEVKQNKFGAQDSTISADNQQ